MSEIVVVFAMMMMMIDSVVVVVGIGKTVGVDDDDNKKGLTQRPLLPIL